jgi:hypothetical protein
MGWIKCSAVRCKNTILNDQALVTTPMGAGVNHNETRVTQRCHLLLCNVVPLTTFLYCLHNILSAFFFVAILETMGPERGAQYLISQWSTVVQTYWVDQKGYHELLRHDRRLKKRYYLIIALTWLDNDIRRGTTVICSIRTLARGWPALRMILHLCHYSALGRVTHLVYEDFPLFRFNLTCQEMKLANPILISLPLPGPQQHCRCRCRYR